MEFIVLNHLTIRAHFTFKTTQSRYYRDSHCVFRVLWVLILVNPNLDHPELYLTISWVLLNLIKLTVKINKTTPPLVNLTPGYVLFNHYQSIPTFPQTNIHLVMQNAFHLVYYQESELSASTLLKSPSSRSPLRLEIHFSL